VTKDANKTVHALSYPLSH